MARNHIILKFLLLSAVAHTFALASWPTHKPPKMPISATLSVGFAALEPAAPSPTPATSAKAKSSQPATAPATISKTKSTPTVRPERAPTKRRDGQRRTTFTVATAATPSAQRSETLVSKAGPTQQDTKVSHNLVENSPPVAARPWESAPVQHYSAEDQIRTANTAAALLHQQQQPTPPPAEVRNTINTSEAARALIRGHLETDLSRYFSYPPIARQRGWQGHVRVAFTIQADGQLTDARITRSSGYHVLDASALEALHRVGRLPQAREWLHGQALPMELPVIYRLEN